MKVEILSSGREARLLEDFVVMTSAGKITVPKGFHTDFASIPQLFQGIIGKFGKHMGPAVIHDYLYRTLLPGRVTRKEADEIFLEEMADADVSYWKRYTMYWAVRIGGSSSWRE